MGELSFSCTCNNRFLESAVTNERTIFHLRSILNYTTVKHKLFFASIAVLKITIFASSKHLLSGAEAGSKLTYQVANIGGHKSAHLTLVLVVVRFKTKQHSIWSKSLTMPLTIWNCVKSYRQKFLLENWLLFSSH